MDDLITRMIMAKEALGSLGPPPSSTINLHPADIRELQEIASPLSGPYSTLYGLRVIADPLAPRLPRRS